MKPQVPSQQCLDMIKHFEGLRLEAYVCPGGELTIGYGHTGKDVIKGMTIDVSEANLFLDDDANEAGGFVNDLVTVPLTQGQFDACTDFVYNLGVGQFKSSTLLKEINAGHMDAAAAEFNKWVYADGKKLPGLVARREAETKMFTATTSV